ncbi:hypothetical protein HGO37_19560 [Rhizobium sp. CG4]|uniref:hypothetical protein n=1 Tax=Rhizobium sp. CG4 TaxID=2726075 RepID=UPI002034496D|nr:hypothetical protein [Rhizobium sp. CG4]MCM2457600.1 hypothetical protein [Rhizobium sp. CG4]
MKTQLFYDFAPYITAASTYLVGVLLLGVHPLLAIPVAVACGYAYNWIDNRLP